MLIQDGTFLKESFTNKIFSDHKGQENASPSPKNRNLKKCETQEVFDLEVLRNSENKILKTSIKKKSKDYQQSKKTIRSFWTSFLKPQLSSCLLTKNSDAFKLLLSHREFSLKVIREVADHFIKKEGEIGLNKVRSFYTELVKILARNKNPNFSKYTSRLSNWCLPILQSNPFSLSIQDRIPASDLSNEPYPLQYLNRNYQTITIPLEHYKELQACWLKHHHNLMKIEFEANTTKHEVKTEDIETQV